MNNELLKLFDIKDDDVDTFTIDNNDSSIKLRHRPHSGLSLPRYMLCPAY